MRVEIKQDKRAPIQFADVPVGDCYAHLNWPNELRLKSDNGGVKLRTGEWMSAASHDAGPSYFLIPSAKVVVE